jgi:hypothetical protein
MQHYLYYSENISVSIIVFHGFSHFLFFLLATAIFVYYLPLFFYGIKTTLCLWKDKNLLYFPLLKANPHLFNYAGNSVLDDFCISLNRGWLSILNNSGSMPLWVSNPQSPGQKIIRSQTDRWLMQCLLSPQADLIKYHKVSHQHC